MERLKVSAPFGKWLGFLATVRKNDPTKKLPPNFYNTFGIKHRKFSNETRGVEIIFHDAKSALAWKLKYG